MNARKYYVWIPIFTVCAVTHRLLLPVLVKTLCVCVCACAPCTTSWYVLLERRYPYSYTLYERLRRQNNAMQRRRKMWFENGKYYFLNTKTLLFVFHVFLRIKIYYWKLFRRVSLPWLWELRAHGRQWQMEYFIVCYVWSMKYDAWFLLPIANWRDAVRRKTVEIIQTLQHFIVNRTLFCSHSHVSLSHACPAPKPFVLVCAHSCVCVCMWDGVFYFFSPFIRLFVYFLLLLPHLPGFSFIEFELQPCTCTALRRTCIIISFYEK